MLFFLPRGTPSVCLPTSPSPPLSPPAQAALADGSVVRVVRELPTLCVVQTEPGTESLYPLPALVPMVSFWCVGLGPWAPPRTPAWDVCVRAFSANRGP